MKIGLYPGTFDPITIGHMDVIDKGSRIFDKLYVCILHNPEKQELFSLNDRLEMIKSSVSNYKNVEVVSYDALTVDACKLYNASYILRGIRDINDFEYELELNHIYKSQDPSIELIYVMAKYKTISSSLIREMINSSKDDFKEMVPNEVYNYIKNILKKDK